MNNKTIVFLIFFLTIACNGEALVEWERQNPQPHDYTINDIWGSSANDIFAVGDYGTILHYDGLSWEPMESSTRRSLRGIWGTSGTNIFAVSDYGSILHYDGNTWSEIAGGSWWPLQNIWGSSENDVFAVGEYGTILHYDGNTWSEMESGTSAWLFGIWVYVVKWLWTSLIKN